MHNKFATPLMGIIFSIVLLIVGLVLFQIAVPQVTTTMAVANLADYTGAGSFIKLIPMGLAVGLVIAAFANGIMAFMGKGIYGKS